MLLVRYQHDDKIHWGHCDGEALGPIRGDVFGNFSRGARNLKLAEVKLLAPCVPSKIVAIGNNFGDRLREANAAPPDVPLIFLKPPTAIVGPDEPILLPPQSQKIEHGAELAIIIGKKARWVSIEDAPKVILGYTCANDVTARDIVEKDGLWTRGKSFDTFCPLGPAIATQLDVADVLITCRVNGQVRQMTSTHDMVFAVPQLVAFVSSVMTLLPGDVILCGTPAGGDLIQAGDTVEVAIEGVGVLKNPVKTESKQ